MLGDFMYLSGNGETEVICVQMNVDVHRIPDLENVIAYWTFKSNQNAPPPLQGWDPVLQSSSLWKKQFLCPSLHLFWKPRERSKKRERERRCPKQKPRAFPNLILKMASCCFCCIVFTRNESVSPCSRQGDYTGHDTRKQGPSETILDATFHKPLVTEGAFYLG